MYVPRSKAVSLRWASVARSVPSKIPLSSTNISNRFYLFLPECIWLYELAQRQSYATPISRVAVLNIFNLSKSYTPTFLHIFMSEITLHTAQLSKSYSAKNCRFLGDTGVDNIIYIIYNIIFYAIYTIQLFFLCRNVGM